MSILVVKIKHEENVSLLKRIISAFREKVDVLSDEEYLDSKFAELIEDVKDSDVVPEETVKKEFKKRGIKY